MGAARVALGRPAAGLVLAALAAAPTACSSGGEAPRLACPRPAIVDGLASAERHRPGAPEDEANLAYRVALQNIGGTCTSSGQDIEVAVAVEVVVEPGPAFAGGAAEVPYFVAVLGPGGEVVDRRDYVARVAVPEGARRAGSSESFGQRFAGVGLGGGAGYRVLFGLSLPREEALRRVEGGG